MTLAALPYRQVWALDFEFVSKSGERPVPVCLVARELRTGRLLRLWQDELPARPPFPTDGDTLIVAYMAAAELSCFLVLGWPMPTRVLDAYAEFRVERNGLPYPHGRGLLGALAAHGLAAISKDEKHDMRALVLRGGPWTLAERTAILDYCQGDVDCLGPLLDRMLPGILARPKGLGQALLRGRYMAAVACMEHDGIPVDTEALQQLRAHWPALKQALVEVVDADYGVFEGTTFKRDRFARYLADRGIAWPCTETGQLCLDRDTFKDMSRQHPELGPLRELRVSLAELRMEQLAVGADGRNRTGLFPYGARSGRNTPGATRYIFAPSVWLRSLIKPAPGRALAYIDWSAQEVGIAAALSGDTALMAAVRSGDPYLEFARMAGLVPSDATKQSHPAERERCKTALLGANYGMGPQSLAARLGVPLLDAEGLLRALSRTFPTLTAWADQTVDAAMLRGTMESVFGWPLNTTVTATSPPSLRNFPCQANGAEMLRIACCLATEREIQVCGPVHDALLIEAPADQLDEVVKATQAVMREASRAVLVDLELTTEVKTIRWPDRFIDPRGERMWLEVMRLLQQTRR